MGELRVDHLAKVFPVARRWGKPAVAHPVFREVAFAVRDGEFVSVIGPSGCGKSTLLNIAAGLENASGGGVFVDGVQVRSPGLDRVVVFQDFALFPWLNVHDNVAFGLKSMRLPKAERERRIARYLELVGLTHFADYYPNRLSGGMRQRVGIARALAVEPAVLLMDEPFGALDALTRQNMQVALSEIWQSTRKTILFITHDIDEAVFLSDRVLVLTGHPSNITQEVAIDMPRPRDPRSDTFRAAVETLHAAITHPVPNRARAETPA